MKKTKLYVSIYIIVSFLIAGCFSSNQPLVAYESLLDNYLNKPIWSFETNDQITSTPTQDRHNIYLRTISELIALDNESGNQLWRLSSQAETPLSMSPFIAGDYVVITEIGSKIVVVNKESGEVIWKSPEIDIALTHTATAEIQSLILQNNTLFVARFDWDLTAYDLTTGQELWKQKIPGRANPYLEAGNNMLFLGAGNGVYAYQPETGKVLWNLNINGYAGPMVFDNEKSILYVINEDIPSISAFNVDTKQILWEKILTNVKSYEIGCLMEYKDRLFIAAEEILALSKDAGKKNWVSSKLGRLECPVILEGVIIVRNTGTTLYGLNLETGDEIGRITIQKNTPMKHEHNRGPVVSEDILIIPVQDNLLIAYRPTTP